MVLGWEPMDCQRSRQPVITVSADDVPLSATTASAPIPEQKNHSRDEHAQYDHVEDQDGPVKLGSNGPVRPLGCEHRRSAGRPIRKCLIRQRRRRQNTQPLGIESALWLALLW